MSTRCVITFKDNHGEHSVYRHCDGYPDGVHGVWASIPKALPFAWDLPRFEADDFGAAYIAAHKKNGGGYLLTTGPDAHGDIEYHYIVTAPNGELHIETRAI